jgi:hypothetical protein
MCLVDIHGGWLRSVTRGLLIVGGGYVGSPAACTPLDVDTHGLCRIKSRSHPVELTGGHTRLSPASNSGFHAATTGAAVGQLEGWAPIFD